jgi:hypothetical protein
LCKSEWKKKYLSGYKIECEISELLATCVECWELSRSHVMINCVGVLAIAYILWLEEEEKGNH